jgi:ketosteroid isomerase-like protein
LWILRIVSTRRANEAELIEVLDQFCSGFASRDADAVLSVCALEPDLIVVTSEEPLLRGPDELRGFLDRYVGGDTTYSWEWYRHDVSNAGSLAWLLAEGSETAASEKGVARHPYRMTMVLERRDDRWLVRQVHGSSPH